MLKTKETASLDDQFVTLSVTAFSSVRFAIKANSTPAAQPLITEELFNKVQERVKESRSRQSVSVSRSSQKPHMLTRLLRCHHCGTMLWPQRQEQDGKTYYVVPQERHG